jgi:hypothetical protein
LVPKEKKTVPKNNIKIRYQIKSEDEKKYTAKQKKGFIYTAFLHFKLVLTSISFPILDLPYLPFHCCSPIMLFPQFLFPSFIKWYLPNFTCFSIAFQLAMKMGFAGETRAKRQAHVLVYSVQPNVMNCLALPILLHLKYTQKRL